jgi:hypothetical protein
MHAALGRVIGAVRGRAHSKINLQRGLRDQQRARSNVSLQSLALGQGSGSELGDA